MPRTNLSTIARAYAIQPTVTGIAEGVAEQKKANAEAANEARLVKFHLDVRCESERGKREVDGCTVVLKDGKVSHCQVAHCMITESADSEEQIKASRRVLGSARGYRRVLLTCDTAGTTSEARSQHGNAI